MTGKAVFIFVSSPSPFNERNSLVLNVKQKNLTTKEITLYLSAVRLSFCKLSQVRYLILTLHPCKCKTLSVAPPDHSGFALFVENIVSIDKILSINIYIYFGLC